MSWAPQYVFFLLLTFYLLNIYLHLELLRWRQTATTTTTTHHLHLQVCDECRLETPLHLEFWYVNYLLLESLCLWNWNQDDNAEWPPPLGRWTGTWDVSSVSWVSGIFFFFFFPFFIIFSIYLNVFTTTTTTLNNRSLRCITSQAQVKFFFTLSLLF